jgi:primosomal protein N' (replication factor Y) (superfamily II helicase)
MGKTFIAEVVLALPLHKSLDYQVPPHLHDAVGVGSRVLVPLEKRKVTGYVVAVKDSSDIEHIKPIEEVLDLLPLFGPSDFIFFKWISSYYFSPLGEVIKTALPSGINVKTNQYLALTPQGKERLHDSTLAPAEKEILSGLAERHKTGLQAFKRTLKDKKAFSLLSLLIQNGLISLSQSTGSRIVQPREEKFFRVNEDQVSQFSFSGLKQMLKKAPRQLQVLKLLHDQGELNQKQIFALRGTGSVVLKALEEKGLITSSFKEVYRAPWTEEEHGIDSFFELTAEQTEAVKKIVSTIKKQQYAPFLLHGVTGSGKTEIYLRTIKATLEAGRGALMLVPEIALTPQLIARFKARFGNQIAQLHSGLSQGERFDEWRRILKGEACIVIGARSAIFAPLPSLGIIVVDEEHDTAYKQEDRVLYNARDMALVKAKMNNAVVVLGSATPAIETYYNTRIGKINYLRLSQRIESRPLPQTEVIDMRKEEPGVILSSRLKEAIKERWGRGEQTLLFLNRRGFSPFVICRECGFTARCPNCAVSLVFHKKKRLLRCHHCNFSQPAPERCPLCQGQKIGIFGFGTERLETEVRRLFQDLKVGRLDRDTTMKKNALQQILGQFRKGETELLIGTQIVAKGHDIPRVTLVGVIAADHSLNFPDFRSGERTFQLLTQVAGRCGRGQSPGAVIIQTYNPEHPSIRQAMSQDFFPFYEQEVSQRDELQYPPFHRMINFRIKGTNLPQTLEGATRLGKLSQELKKKEKVFKDVIDILGPVEAPREKLKGKYRFQMLIKGPDYRILHSFTERIITKIFPHLNIPGVKISVDVDPIDLL